MSTETKTKEALGMMVSYLDALAVLSPMTDPFRVEMNNNICEMISDIDETKEEVSEIVKYKVALNRCFVELRKKSSLLDDIADENGCRDADNLDASHRFIEKIKAELGL